MSDTPEKVESTVEAPAAETTEAKKAKKGVDLNDAAAKGKEGLSKATGFITNFFAEDPEKGLMYAMGAPAVCAVLGFLAGGNPVVNILSLLVAAAAFLGVKALRDKLYPKESA